MLRLILAAGALAAASLAVAGCGPSLADLQVRETCISDCGLRYMTCLDGRTCVDMDGQQIPCEEDCSREKAACESTCPGA